MTIKEVISTVEARGYQLDKRPYKLNLVGIRNLANTQPNEFQDKIAYFFFDEYGNVLGNVARGTTSPSVYFLQNPMNLEGTAILQQGQYVNAYSIGLHKGKYQALVQVRPVTVIRDSDRNSYLDFFADTQTGLYGINIHKATIGKSNEAIIGQDSAGCQVFMNESDFNDMMRMAYKSRDLYGNTFSYTLIDERNILKKRVNYAVVGGIIIALTAYVFFLQKTKDS